jgi:hypothetical protein
MVRPTTLGEDMVRVTTTVSRSDKKTLAALAAESDISERSLLRLFITTGMQAYSNTIADMGYVPTAPSPRGGARR